VPGRSCPAAAEWLVALPGRCGVVAVHRGVAKSELRRSGHAVLARGTTGHEAKCVLFKLAGLTHVFGQTGVSERPVTPTRSVRLVPRKPSADGERHGRGGTRLVGWTKGRWNGQTRVGVVRVLRTSMPKRRSKTSPSASELPSGPQRLQKVLAAAGIGSRRECEEYILAGRVTVDGQVVDQLGVKVDPAKQSIAVDGEPIRLERKVYYMLNKPPGVLCTNRDPSGRPRVIDLFPPDGPRLFTVGRLDEHSQGLLIVTNDGDLANRLAHPRYRIPRTYRVQVAGIPTGDTLIKKLRQG